MAKRTPRTEKKLTENTQTANDAKENKSDDISQESILAWITANWDKIPDNFKTTIKPSNYSTLVPGVKFEGHTVVWLLNRQKPSVYSDYNFDEERIGINRFGQIIWGFDSGCSCPIPWEDEYPQCYTVSSTWKQFKIDKFDPDYFDEVIANFKKIKSSTAITELIIDKNGCL